MSDAGDTLRLAPHVSNARAFGFGQTRLILTVATILGTILSISLIDRPAAFWSHADFHGIWAFVALTHLVDPLPPAASIGFLVLGIAALSGRRPGPIGWVILQACVALLVAVMIKDQGKFVFGRLWPETWINNNPSLIGTGAYGFFPFHGGTGWASFPSGHMTAITAPMVAIQPALRRWWWVTVVPIGLVAIGLFGADYHFVGDMLAGTLLGAVCAWAIVSLMPRPETGIPTKMDGPAGSIATVSDSRH
ncbi:phosphatase PAP2 family protein [Lichenihabitans psoromatis]|uniref:phosphatase PAP2 family protein n=1 Tax=Lichenihabitans psoromatis TaxID=2528642 RepID=UPI001035AB89|nr:phosphatase PAP2 family protein [Lichenihabitans psoromatis]